MHRALTKRKSENDVTEGCPPVNKRLLTERIAAGMGVLRLNDAPPDAQGNTRPPFVRTTSTPSAFYNGPAFTPSRPDLVSSFGAPQSMDGDLEMACDTSPSLSAQNQQFYTPQPLPPSNYTQPPQLLNNGPPNQYAIIPVSECKDVRPLYPIIEDDEHEDVSILKLRIPKIPQPTLDIPLLHKLTSNPESRALILYTPPKTVIEESIERGRNEKYKEKITNIIGQQENSPPPDQGDVMMLD